ncbi:MAG: TlpA family protein disulfide reductase [Cyclobacteriaceae bacterium]|nr:TlpA family protein disulfide reductase [Cyclobacteriaceae bacterium]
MKIQRRLILCITLAAVLFYVPWDLTAQVRHNYFVDFEGTRFAVNENSVVKDTAGVVLAYSKWTEMMQTGNYRLRPYSIVNGKPTEMLIREHTKQELIDIRERMEGRMNTKPQTMKQGDTFDNFALKDITGKTWVLSELKGKIIVINFWFTGCAPCIMEIPELNTLVEKYKNKDVVFLALAMGDDETKIRKFLERKPFNYNLIPHKDARNVISRYGIMAFPTHVVLDAERKITYTAIGYHEETVASLDKEIVKLID